MQLLKRSLYRVCHGVCEASRFLVMQLHGGTTLSQVTKDARQVQQGVEEKGVVSDSGSAFACAGSVGRLFAKCSRRAASPRMRHIRLSMLICGPPVVIAHVAISNAPQFSEAPCLPWHTTLDDSSRSFMP